MKCRPQIFAKAKRSPFAPTISQQKSPRLNQAQDPVKIGYARVSTAEKNLDMQLRALEEAGCTHIFSDTASGAKSDREGLYNAIRQCSPGDMLVVWKLDRLGRSLIDLVALVEELRFRDIGLRVLTGQGAMIDTSKADGRMILGIFAVLAEFERELIRERTKAGMDAAKARGVLVGRPRKLTTLQIGDALRSISQGIRTPTQLAGEYGVHVTTLKRAIRQAAKTAL